MTLDVPAHFVEKIVSLHGDAGAVWLRDLPRLVADLAERWNVVVGEPFALSYNYVAAATRSDGTEAVLKVCYPEHDAEHELAAVRHYDGDGMCRLLEADDARHAMLLERLRPGEMLLHLAREDDDAATRVGAEVMRALWRPVADAEGGGTFRPLVEWFDAFDRHRAEYGGSGPFPSRLFDRAEAVAHGLLASSPTPTLLHADFHHYNVLSADRRPWLAIDPKGMVGDPGYEIGPFLLNPVGDDWHRNPAVVNRRLDILADELAYGRARLRDWVLAYAMLSACWNAENSSDRWHDEIAMAQILADL